MEEKSVPKRRCTEEFKTGQSWPVYVQTTWKHGANEKQTCLTQSCSRSGQSSNERLAKQTL